MNTVRKRVETTHLISLEIEDEVEPIESSMRGATTFWPKAIILRWTFESATGWQLTKADVMGLMQLKNGNEGSRWLREDFARFDGSLHTSAPEWLPEVVEEYRPTGTVITP